MVAYHAGLETLQSQAVQNQDVEINDTRAAEILAEFGIQAQAGAGSSSDLATAITGMTEIEAFLFLNEIFSRIDAADGSADGNMALADQTAGGFDSALTAIGLDTSNPDESPLILAADVFKQDDNPTDAQYIAQIQASNSPAINATPADTAVVGVFNTFLDALDGSESDLADDAVADVQADTEANTVTGADDASDTGSDDGGSSGQSNIGVIGLDNDDSTPEPNALLRDVGTGTTPGAQPAVGGVQPIPGAGAVPPGFPPATGTAGGTLPSAQPAVGGVPGAQAQVSDTTPAAQTPVTPPVVDGAADDAAADEDDGGCDG